MPESAGPLDPPEPRVRSAQSEPLEMTDNQDHQDQLAREARVEHRV